VADLERATRFYAECLGLPRLETPPSITFFELGKTWLALWPWESLAADAGLAPQGSGFRGFALAHNVRSPAEVDALLARAAAGGGTLTKPGHATDWGGYSGYFTDPMALSGRLRITRASRMSESSGTQGTDKTAGCCRVWRASAGGEACMRRHA